MQQSPRDRIRGSWNARISFHVTQLIAIKERFVAAVTGDYDRWLLFMRTNVGYHSNDPEAAGQPRRPFGRGRNFRIRTYHQRLRSRRWPQAFENGQAPNKHQPKQNQTKKNHGSRDLADQFLA